MDVNLASQTHHTPQVGFPHNEPVTIEINEKVQPIGAKLFANRGINLILKIKLKIEAIPMNPKQPRAIKDDGTCTYIILTESPWIQSGGDNNNEYINPTITTTTSKITKLFIVLFVNDKILFGKKFLNIISILSNYQTSPKPS